MVVTAGAAAAASTGANAVDSSVLQDITTAQDTLDVLGSQLRERMSELHALQDSFETAVGKQSKMVSAVQASQVATDRERQENGTTDDVEAELSLLRGRLTDMHQLMPRRGGAFVELFLGGLNVRFVRKTERMAFKKEYEMLKLKLAPLFVVFAGICLVFDEYRWLHMCLQLALSCYYVSLAVRENILRVNGSNIRPWWIIHHYFTVMQGVLLMTWPDGVSYALFRRKLHLFGLYNSVLMIFQTRYQMARLYALRSLGRASEMDVASSDSSQIHWSETMRLLLPLIVFGQIMQGYEALTLFGLYRRFPTELQILLLALLFTANFIGNSTTTMQVLLAKRAASKRTTEPDSQSSTIQNGVPATQREDKKSL